jgi:hypothetical protein
MGQLVLDGHAHCGFTVPFEELSIEWQQGGIDGGVVFSPVEEIYDRYDPFFTDSTAYRQSRRSVHDYLLRIGAQDHIYPYFFVWNDFPSVPRGFVGIKWHRHSGEPVYAYDAPGCKRAIEGICEKHLPVVLEEEFHNTLSFLQRIAGRTVVIIPHMGGLNGGYFRLKKAGIFESPSVWVDTALAGRAEVEDFAENFGPERIIFGSDYPFGVPAYEKQRLDRIFSGNDLTAVLAGNLLRLLAVPARDTFSLSDK